MLKAATGIGTVLPPRRSCCNWHSSAQRAAARAGICGSLCSRHDTRSTLLLQQVCTDRRVHPPRNACLMHCQAPVTPESHQRHTRVTPESQERGTLWCDGFANIMTAGCYRNRLPTGHTNGCVPHVVCGACQARALLNLCVPYQASKWPGQSQRKCASAPCTHAPTTTRCAARNVRRNRITGVLLYTWSNSAS